jgi:nucleotide-binding universal stress UspA family protein/quercetin dioxygenase-like cupin family protein
MQKTNIAPEARAEGPTMAAIQTILHPTDFSEHSRHAFETACALARDHNARLILLHVMPPSVAPVLPTQLADPLRPAEAQDSLRGRYRWPQPADPTLRVEHRVAEGDPHYEILYLAQALPCDLIVMGSHGRTGLNRLLAGSVAEEVFRKAGCPVLLVKTPPPGAPTRGPEPPAKPGAIVDVRPLGAALASAKTKTLARADNLEVRRLVVPAGQEVAEHKARGMLVVHCLEGRVTLRAWGKARDLRAGELLYLPAGEPHSVMGVEDASLLLTAVLPKG